jgi:hypothetical protein
MDWEYHYPTVKIPTFLALKNLRPEDQIALFTFKCGKPNVFEKLSDFTYDRLSIAEQIDKIKLDVNSGYICDALYRTSLYLREKAPVRRCAIL